LIEKKDLRSASVIFFFKERKKGRKRKEERRAKSEERRKNSLGRELFSNLTSKLPSLFEIRVLGFEPEKIGVRSVGESSVDGGL